MSRALSKQPRDGISAIIAHHVHWLPMVVVLGLGATLLEGIGVGMLIPILAFLSGSALPDGLPGPIRELTVLAGTMGAGRRIFVLGGLVLVLIVAKSLVQSANLALQVRLQGRLAHEIRSALAQRLLHAGYPFILEQQPGRLVDILTSDVWTLTSTMRAVLGMIASGTALLVIAAVLAWVDWRLTLVIAGGGGVVLGGFALLERQLRRLSVGVKEASTELEGRMAAVLHSPRTIRLFSQEGREARHFEQVSERLRKALERLNLTGAVAVPLIDVGVSAVFIAIIVAGHLLAVPLATVIVYLVLLSRAQPHIKSFSDARVGMAQVSTSAREVNWLLAVPVTAAAGGAAAGGAVPDLAQPIRFDSVTFTYPNEGAGLNGASFTLRSGEVTALVGPSGAGKSTVVNLLCRLVEPSSGKVFLGDTPADRMSPAAWRTRIAVAGQDAELMEGTVAENIAYGCPEAPRAAIEEVARLADAHDFIAALPSGYETQVGRVGLSLSGGQRQRIGLARALLVRPDLLILDEATSAVDSISETRILALLSSRSHFRTALVISHRAATLAVCSDAIVLEAGRVIEAGPLASLDYHRIMAGMES